MFAEKEWRFLSIAAGLVCIIALFSFLYPFPLRYWFFTGFQGIYIISFGLILGKIWKWTIGKAGIVILAAFLIFYSGEKIYNLYISISPTNDGGVAKINAIDAIYKDAKGKNFRLLIFTPPVYTYAYDYLILWYGKKSTTTYPNGEKRNILLANRT